MPVRLLPPMVEVWLEAPHTTTYGEGGVTCYSRPVIAFHYTDTWAEVDGWDHEGETPFDTILHPDYRTAEAYERKLRRMGWVDITETVMNDAGYTFTATLPPGPRQSRTAVDVVLPDHSESEVLATDNQARSIVYDLCAGDLFLALKKGKGKSARWWRRRIRKIAKTYDRYSSECQVEADGYWAETED